jgi:hypothetical protein
MRDEQTDNPWAPWLGRLAASRKRRDDRVAEWQSNVAKRKGDGTDTSTISSLATQTRSVTVNQDAPLTKAKIASLYSQTPEVRLSPRRGMEQFRAALQPFGQELNDTITEASVGSTIEEILADVVNAAGIGGALASCQTRTETREVPLMDPALLPPQQQAAVLSGQVQLPTTTVDHPVDRQYLATRISPADLLIPSDFTGSNYDHARWLGHDGRMTWAQAVSALGVTEAQKDDVLGKDARASGTTNTLNTEATRFRDTDVVLYTRGLLLAALLPRGRDEL